MDLFKDYTELSMINLDNPEFGKNGKVHDWRNYVPYEWQKDWSKLSERERHFVAIMAQRMADNEEWD